MVSGGLVSVPFGKKKHYSGLVYRTVQTPPDAIETIKPIEKVISGKSIIHPEQLRFWEWIAQYYLCSWGEVSRMVLPCIIRSKEKPPVKMRRRKNLKTFTGNGTEQITWR